MGIHSKKMKNDLYHGLKIETAPNRSNSDSSQNNNDENSLIMKRTKSLYSKNLFEFKYDDKKSIVPDMSGYLIKTGRRLSLSVKRWYLLHSNFLYVFKTATDTKPRHVILLHGCQIKAISDGHNKYGIEL